MANVTEVQKLLESNGYVKHPLLGFYWNKHSLGNCFILDEKEIVVLKNKWKNIDLTTERRVKYSNFNPRQYDLKTPLKPVLNAPKKKQTGKDDTRMNIEVDMYENGTDYLENQENL